MNTMKTFEGPDAESLTPTTQVPLGWQRKVDHTRVVYISPSGSVLACLEHVKSYLLTDGTCKCGLECPLILPKVFNFDPEASVRLRTTEDAKADGDVTKLCIHKRKIIAVATLHKNMESPNPSLVLTSPSGDTSSASFTHSLSNAKHDGPTRFLPEESNRSYLIPVTTQKHFQHDMGSPPQQDIYSNYNRMKQGSNEHVDRKSPYRHRLSGLLSPSSGVGSHPYLDGSPSSRSDSLLSPDLSAGFQGTCSPGRAHASSAPTTPLSPLRASHLRSSPSTQPSCAMAGRGPVPPAPSSAAKSPVMKPPSRGFPQNMDMFHHKAQSVLHLNPHHPQLPSCVMAKPQVTSEKDPLGILDPIPSHSSMGPNLSGLQTNAHTQVPPVNVNMHSTTVPLPSNLPLPTAKPGPTGHSNRGQYRTALSASPSSITPPTQMTASSLARMDTHHHSTQAVSSLSGHGDLAALAGLQTSFGLTKSTQSTRSSLISPYPIMSSDPTAESEVLQNYKDYKDHSSHFLGGINNTLRKHSNQKYQGFGSSGRLQKSNQGMIGLNHILKKRNPATFPASNLLSAAAKAQTASKNVSASGDMEAGAPVGHHNMNAVADSHPPVVSEAQSGRAALRDKLMAQQRDPFHRNRQLSNSNNTAFNMPKSKYRSSASRFLGSSEFVRKPPLQHGFKGSASMAQLLQTMSSTHNGISQTGQYLGGSAQSPFRDGMISAGAALHSQQVLPCPQDGMNFSQFQNMEQHGVEDSAVMNHYQLQSHAEDSWMGRDGQLTMGSQAPCKPHQQLASHHYYPLNTPHINRGTAFPHAMMPNGYAQTLSGDASTRNTVLEACCQSKDAARQS